MKVSYSNLKIFEEISSVLTGFSKIELEATGMINKYFETILLNSIADDVNFFFEKAATLLAEPHLIGSEADLEYAISTQLIPSSNYNGLAKNIILLWYTGNWGSKVVSADSYIQGLMWNAGHTHPPGAKQPGYGSWAIAPLS